MGDSSTAGAPVDQAELAGPSAEECPQESIHQARLSERMAFRQSPEYKQAISFAYHTSIYVFLTASCLMFRRYYNQPPTLEVRLMELGIISTATAAALYHYWQMRLTQDVQLSSRQWWLTGNRFVRAVMILSIASNVRRNLQLGSLTTSADSLLYTAESDPTLMMSLRNLIYVSLCISHLLHGLGIPLMFYPQLAFGLFELTALLVLHLPSSVHILNSAGSTAGLNTICYKITAAHYFVELAMSGNANNVANRLSQCDKHHTVMVVLFAHICLSLLPVYVSYRLEWWAKTRFLNRVQRTGTNPSISWIADAILLASCATVVWSIVCNWHEKIMGFSLPLLLPQNSY